MIGLVFGLEKNVCGYILLCSDSRVFFFGGFAHGLPGGGRGLGFEECTMDPCLVKNVRRPSKTLVIGIW